MRKDLEVAYIPLCDTCQQNKSTTHKLVGTLCPLPISHKHGDSVAIDFRGPLPEHKGYNYIITITNHLNSDICLIPLHSSITAPQLAHIFFYHWFCKNGLPLSIVSDQDKLFLSHFWKVLHAKTGIRLKMPMVYHPETKLSFRLCGSMSPGTRRAGFVPFLKYAFI